jgi:hypothetical protein
MVQVRRRWIVVQFEYFPVNADILEATMEADLQNSALLGRM